VLDEVVEPGDEADPDHQRQQREVARLREEPRKELCVLGDVLGGDDRGALGAEYLQHEHVRDVRGDEVEHDCRDHLVGVGVRLQRARNRAPEAAADGTREDSGDDQRDARDRPPGSGRREHGQCGRKTPDDQLALCPDVEQPGAERDRDGEPGEDQQRRFRERQPEREVERRPGWVDEPRLTPTANGYPSAPLNRTRYTSTGS